MEHKGIRYTIGVGTERDQWFVAIYPAGVEVERRRVSGDRQDAGTRARAMIQRWLKLNGAQRSPGGSSGE